MILDNESVPEIVYEGKSLIESLVDKDLTICLNNQGRQPSFIAPRTARCPIWFTEPGPICPIHFDYWDYYNRDPFNLVTAFENMWTNEPHLDDPYNGLENIANANKLYAAKESCMQHVKWKDSVQKSDLNDLKMTRDLQREIRNGIYKQRPVNEFPLNERGKTRLIKSNDFRDRVVQKAL